MNFLLDAVFVLGEGVEGIGHVGFVRSCDGDIDPAQDCGRLSVAEKQYPHSDCYIILILANMLKNT